MEILPKLECNGKWKQIGHRKSTKNNKKQHNYNYTHKTKYKTSWIHNNWNKKYINRIQNIYNQTQLKKNIQENTNKKQVKTKKNIKKQKKAKIS